ncbi:MAG: tyrosine-type recombinase/integrase [Alphaproteobacteria bacterium]|nr:tyrosine-type recombinase/integrase [Alphaproteobacteria bacterium]MBU0804919.1 tyrosine-type recombinase/integrase [Alphaproteobacteria bacterium]MBU0870418.1 tyrosine-type recombinase/integrase [Alphaproteobacteria bacterium]MBU1401907.1 tyrosine-type recombinase/integrase [Alphaproteobacteria bacterium]MBU1591676.1 tyrosine-type recombinase/integrase [Alphaproteobacteria bacterium]
MGITLKRVQIDSRGVYTYRRKLPRDVFEAIKQREFKRRLGQSEREAVKNYPHADAECERLIASARQRSGKEQDAAPTATPLDHWREASSELNAMRLEYPEVFSDRCKADLWADSMLEGFPTGPDGYPAGVPEVTRLIANALRAGGASFRRPAPTLEDVRRLYIRERITGSHDENRAIQGVDRAIGHVVKALHADEARDVLLTAVGRDEARDIRDYLSRDLGKTAATVERILNDIRAIFRFGLKEFGFGKASHFDGLGVPGQKAASHPARNAIRERDPFPEHLIPKMAARLSERSRSEDLTRIWTMLAGTGCRLAEVTGLPVSDVHLDAPIPYLDISQRPNRRLKNSGSARWVPLVGNALAAASKAVQAAGGGNDAFLFPRYAVGRGANSASAALMKHIKAVQDNRKVVVHSLRHLMEDRLIRARVPKDVRDMVLGHSSGDMGERYGSQQARLEVAYDAVKAAVGEA